jgi:mannose-6-phosphate isomerase-like protein (cupin superfamily)
VKVNRYQELAPYAADGHFDMHCLRVQGHDASPARTSWMGISLLLPGGHTSMTPSPVEKMYLVLDGEVVMSNGQGEVTLSKHDSCYFAPGEARQVRNATNGPASVLLVMPYQPKPQT